MSARAIRIKRASLKTFPVEVADGAVWLVG